MKTIILGILVGLVGCAGESADYSREALTADAGSDAMQDAGFGDACVMAMGNCGCVFYEEIDNGVVTKSVVCP
jgi:hypothetical protein